MNSSNTIHERNPDEFSNAAPEATLAPPAKENNFSEEKLRLEIEELSIRALRVKKN